VTAASDRDDLYGLPLERFTAERNALAKRLGQEGQRAEAAEVSKLRKPSAAAWAVNQLARTQRRGIDGLLKAGDRLVSAQAGLLTGRDDPSALRDAVEAERSAVDELVERARGLLNASGIELSAAQLDRVRETLHAAALDEAARAQVRGGCLVRELRHVGLGSFAGRPAGPSRAARADEKRRREAEARRAAAERRQEAEARLRDAEGVLDAAREAYDRAVSERDQAQRALDKLG
jgi:hypothetical protein